MASVTAGVSGPRAWLGWAVAFLLFVLGLREVVQQTLWLFLAHQSQGWGDLLLALGRFVVAIAVANAVWIVARRRALGRDAGIGALIAAPVVGALWWANLQHHDRPDGFLRWDFAPDRVAGRFPFEAGATRPFTVAGKTTDAHIGPDGLRRCGVQPDGATTRVALIGDSFVFGKGVTDDGTLCWKLREQLDAAGRHDVAVFNMGQPGANAVSYADNLAFAAETLHVDTAMVGFLVPDDSQPMDLNDHRRIVRSAWFRALGSALDPETLLAALPPIFELSYSDFVVEAIVGAGIDRVVQTARTHDVRLVIYFYGDRGLPVDWFVARARSAAAGDPDVEVIGVFTPPPEIGPYIQGDGHPAPAGNAWYAQQLRPYVDAPARRAP